MFRSSNHPGFTAAIADNPRRVEARKLEHEVTVRFTPLACTVQTPEGTVHAQPGDAILCGPGGEQWRVSKAHFDNKYRAVPPTVAGDMGRYLSLRNRVLALQMAEPFDVLLADGLSRLVGRPGDWLVDYGDGSLGIVAAGVFSSTYEVMG
jgi:PGDYG protein